MMNDNAKIPVILIHRGYSDYMEFSLRQAATANPGGKIVLLGDASSPEIPGVRCVMARDYETAALAEFRRHYRHMSYQPEVFERTCFERWLALAEFIRRENISAAFVLDTDVMLYVDLTWLARHFPPAVKCGLAETVAGDEAGADGYIPVSGHSSYWTAPAMFEFEEFLKRLYAEPELRRRLEERWAGYAPSHIYGGITDMDALGLFRRGLRDDEFINTNVLPGCGGVFDLALGLSQGAVEEQYRLRGLTKRLEWRHGLPCGADEAGAAVRFYTLHCQGRYKPFMAGFYYGPDFPGRLRLTARFNCRKYQFMLERLVKTGIKAGLGKIAPALLRRLRQNGK